MQRGNCSQSFRNPHGYARFSLWKANALYASELRVPEPHPMKLGSTCGRTNSASTVKAQGSTVIKT